MSRSIGSFFCIILFIFLVVPFFGFASSVKQSRLNAKAENRLRKLENVLPEWHHVGKIGFDSLSLRKDQNLIQIFFTSPLSYVPVREAQVDAIVKSVRNTLGRKFRKYRIEIFTDHHLLTDLVPNLLRSGIPIDTSRIYCSKIERIPVVTRIGKEKPLAGLYANNIALWDSHGWYYESKQDRWKWQRARLFGTVEDMSPMSYILPYLVPMLENCGANVFLPRERDWQSEEIVIDNDRSTVGSEMLIPAEIVPQRLNSGFLKKDTLVTDENPFLMGTSLVFNKLDINQNIKYIPDFKTKGRYSVSVSYQSDSTRLNDVKYTVAHSGGTTLFHVNQKIGGGSWIYLGTFDFFAGINPETGMVTISHEGNQKGSVSADAVKFGGGMGNVARRPLNETPSESPFEYKLSGKPRYLEGARYYLQSAGFPDTLTYNPNKNKNDYNDDYQSRGEWVNYLMGKPNGPDKNRNSTGLKIPIDLALAFHTDAGVTSNDSIIGTLGIYSTRGDKGSFLNGKSRLASRDLSDIIQTEVVDDIRQQFNPNWTRRGLWDKQYSEAWRPNVPAMLLELLSHQNIADMRYGLDPRFRFSVSRAIYKGILKFQAFQENRSFVVQPLPVDHFAITKLDSNFVKLTWRAVNDPSEPTAKADHFSVYKRVNDGGFDNGIIVNDTSLVIRLDKNDRIYSYKVTALNAGGESFPGETLSVGISSRSKGNILVVNGFDRICGPAIFDQGGMAGLAQWKDHGVADHQDISYVGEQYDFKRNSKWLDDDSPGWGASYGNMEGKVIPGNSFDYPYIHGKAIMAAGYSFVSTSRAVFCESDMDFSPYFTADIIMGEERSTPNLKDSTLYDYKIYTSGFKSAISELSKKGLNIFLSGAYIGSEFGEAKDSVTTDFAKRILHFNWRTGHASKGGGFYATDYARKWLKGSWNFSVGYNPEIYSVEAPDGIEPVGPNAWCAFRYSENNVSAGIVYKGKNRIVALGLPFETILDESGRNSLMEQIITFFKSK